MFYQQTIMKKTQTIVIGGNAAGLACAARLNKLKLPHVILEKNAGLAQTWINHYDRLHLHTSKDLSALPFEAFDKSLPTYPSRNDVVDYLINYAKKRNIIPEFNTEVISVSRVDEMWEVKTTNETYLCEKVIFATGNTNIPNIPKVKGIESFEGKILHSSNYKNGKEFQGKNVLVVGFGNSACEQAICLSENGAFPTMSVRSAVNVIPRDVFGIPILKLGLVSAIFPAPLADKINAPLIKFLIGDIEKYGLKKSKIGPIEQIKTTGRIPLLDIGTMNLIKEGKIKVQDGIDHIDGNKVYFKNGSSNEFDAILFATGYLTNLKQLLGEELNAYEPDLIKPLKLRKSFGQNGLYFCGFYVSPNGMLREITRESKIIADHISKNNQPV